MDRPETPLLYEFGDFRLDPTQRRLLLKADGRALPVTSRAFDTLLYFVEHPGELLEKTTLLKAIWPNTIVEENNLNQNITVLRRVLGEVPGEHRFIVTVPGRGFRFVAVVRTLREASAHPPELSEPAASTPLLRPEYADPPARGRTIKARGWIVTWGIASVALAVIGGRLLWFLASPSAEQASTGAAKSSSLPALSAPPTPMVVLPPAGKFRVAILPFENLSPDPENAFFADGLHEEILSTIAQRLPSVEVVSRTTMMSYRQNPPKPIATVARELNASHLIEGSVRREANKVRLTLQLIDARTDRHMWSRNYDRTLSSALTLQSEVAGEVGSQLSVQLAGGVLDDPTFTTHSPEAYDAYLRARVAMQSTYMFSSNLDEWQGVMRALDSVVAHDPNFTPARVERMLVALRMFVASYDTSEERLRQVHDDLAAAQRLAAYHPWVLLAQADYRFHVELDPVRALESVRAAQSIGIADNRALELLASMLFLLGRVNEALPIFEQASTLDPHNPMLFGLWAQGLWDLHKPADALRVLDNAIALHAPLQDSRGQLLFAFTGQTQPLRRGVDQMASMVDPGSRLTMDFDVMRFEHRYAELRQLLAAAKPEVVRLEPNPSAMGLAPTALYRGWTDLLLGDLAAAASEGKTVVRFATDQKQTKWNRTILRALLAEGNALQGNRSAAVTAAREVLALTPRSQDPYSWAHFAAPSAARVLAWSGSKDEAAALLDELADTIPSDGPAKITRDPLYNMPLADNDRYRRVRERLEARIRETTQQLSAALAH
jgi:TolB-like protein/DNA-binding winged helix-turn-helix (wHTH) protein/tetratricopeptide (TPR) repeat protein